MYRYNIFKNLFLVVGTSHLVIIVFPYEYYVLLIFSFYLDIGILHPSDVESHKDGV